MSKPTREELIEEAKRLRSQKIWVRKCASFEEANAFDEAYYASMTPEERIADWDMRLDIYCKMKGIHSKSLSS